MSDPAVPRNARELRMIAALEVADVTLTAIEASVDGAGIQVTDEYGHPLTLALRVGLLALYARRARREAVVAEAERELLQDELREALAAERSLHARVAELEARTDGEEGQ
jgi:hypothetical protein